VALSLAFAAASYVFVERPFLRLKRRDRDALEGRAAADASTGFASGAPAPAASEAADGRG
jgi:peptidoglycan/LPS O-acetylase OafA/YrhL